MDARRIDRANVAMNIAIRPAAIDDCESIAQVHVQSWRDSYKNILPASILDSLSIHERLQMWQSAVSDGGRYPVYVAQLESRIVGFVCGGNCRDERLGRDKEVYAIYVSAVAKRCGIGSQLISSLAQHFVRDGSESAGVWVLKENWPARLFYERFGATLTTEK